MEILLSHANEKWCQHSDFNIFLAYVGLKAVVGGTASLTSILSTVQHLLTALSVMSWGNRLRGLFLLPIFHENTAPVTTPKVNFFWKSEIRSISFRTLHFLKQFQDQTILFVVVLPACWLMGISEEPGYDINGWCSPIAHQISVPSKLLWVPRS